MSKPTAKRLHAKRLARKRKPSRQRADTGGWPVACVDAAAAAPLVIATTVTGRWPASAPPTVRATSNTGA